MLPDVALLEIFQFYVDEEEWYTLVHVCRKWRNVVFGSPRRLNLRLSCIASTPTREMLDIWPHNLPITVWDERDEVIDDALDMDNIFAALEHNDRICNLDLAYFGTPSPGLKKVLAALQRPFPELTSLELWCGESTPVQPDSFLGGSAPRLRSLFLSSIPFPGLPKLLLSATHLVNLGLQRIPHSGYISPEAMVTSLSVLTRLEVLKIEFESLGSRLAQKSRYLPPQTRTLLPVLTGLRFVGVDQYLEDFVARIDAPLLKKLDISFNHRHSFDTLQITQFISRSLKFKTYNEARVVFSDGFASGVVRVTLPQESGGGIELAIYCEAVWQLSSLVQLCSSFRQGPISVVENLYITEDRVFPPDWPDDNESNQWQELFHAFTAVKGLYISREFVTEVASALVGERVTEVFPALRTLFLEETLSTGPLQEIIEFVAARQVAGHPISVSNWERKPYE